MRAVCCSKNSRPARSASVCSVLTSTRLPPTTGRGGDIADAAVTRLDSSTQARTSRRVESAEKEHGLNRSLLVVHAIRTGKGKYVHQADMKARGRAGKMSRYQANLAVILKQYPAACTASSLCWPGPSSVAAIT